MQKLTFTRSAVFVRFTGCERLKKRPTSRDIEGDLDSGALTVMSRCNSFVCSFRDTLSFSDGFRHCGPSRRVNKIKPDDKS